jgi:hypothetical protein
MKKKIKKSIHENINIEPHCGYRIKNGNTVATFFVDGIDGDTVHATLGNGSHRDLSLAKLYLMNISIMESKKFKDPFLTIEEVMDIDSTFAASMVRKGIKKVRSSIVEQTLIALKEGIETGEEFEHKGKKWKVMETQSDEQGTVTMKLKRAEKSKDDMPAWLEKKIEGDKKSKGDSSPEWEKGPNDKETFLDALNKSTKASKEALSAASQLYIDLAKGSAGAAKKSKVESRLIKSRKLNEEQDKWGFDSTEISASNWKAILSMGGAQGSPVLRGSGQRGGWVWQGQGVKIITSNDPFTGERYDSNEHPGMYDTSKDYVGYIGIEGEAEKVKEIAKEIKKRASYVKGTSPHDRDFI